MSRRRTKSARRSWAPRIRTAAAAAAAEAAPATAAAPAAAAAAAGRLGLLDLNGPAVEAGAVQLADGLLGLFGRRHFDEPEAARAASVPVCHDARGFDRATRRERLAQTLVGGGEGEAADAQFDRRSKRSLCLCLPTPVHDPELGRRSGTRPDGEEGSRRTDDRTRHGGVYTVPRTAGRIFPRGASGRALHRASAIC